MYEIFEDISNTLADLLDQNLLELVQFSQSLIACSNL